MPTLKIEFRHADDMANADGMCDPFEYKGGLPLPGVGDIVQLEGAQYSVESRIFDFDSDFDLRVILIVRQVV